LAAQLSKEDIEATLGFKSAEDVRLMVGAPGDGARGLG